MSTVARKRRILQRRSEATRRAHAHAVRSNDAPAATTFVVDTSPEYGGFSRSRTAPITRYTPAASLAAACSGSQPRVVGANLRRSSGVSVRKSQTPAHSAGHQRGPAEFEPGVRRSRRCCARRNHEPPSPPPKVGADPTPLLAADRLTSERHLAPPTTTPGQVVLVSEIRRACRSRRNHEPSQSGKPYSICSFCYIPSGPRSPGNAP